MLIVIILALEKKKLFGAPLWERKIAVDVVARFEREFPKEIEQIYFVLFDKDTEKAYETEVDKLY